MNEIWKLTSFTEVIIFLKSISFLVQILGALSLTLICTDGITGLIRSTVSRRLDSHKWRMRALSKCSLYFGTIVLGFSASLVWAVLFSPTFISSGCIFLAFGCVIVGEAISVTENITIAARATGLDIKFAKPVFRFFIKILEATQEHVETTAISQSMVVSKSGHKSNINNEEEPVILHTQTETYRQKTKWNEGIKGEKIG